MSPARLGAFPALLLLAFLGVALLSPAAGAAEDPGVRTVPARNSVVGTAPSVLRVFPDALPALGAPPAGAARIFDSAGDHVATVPLGPAEAGGLAGSMPELDPGVHLISWTAGDASGSFAFDVEQGAGSPTQLVQKAPPPKLKDTADVALEWVGLIAVYLVVGALTVRFLATGPAASRVAGPSGQFRGVDLRLTRVAAVGAALYLPVTWFATGWDDGSENWGAAWEAFGDGAAGGVLLARFLVMILGALIVVPLALRRRPPVRPALAVALGCGLVELVLRHVPTKQPPVLTRAIFDDLMWAAHQFGGALWIGGLTAFLALVVASPVPPAARAAFWPTAIRRFSLTALGSVAALVLSGLWLYWVHVDGVKQLFTTLYGQTLVVKFAILAGLLLIGGLNLFFVMPRAEVHGAAGNSTAMGDLIRRHFRATVAIEVVLGVALLFVAGFLGGSSRNQALQAGDHLFRTTQVVDGATVGLTPSALQPGLVGYVVDVDAPSPPQQVDLTFSGGTFAADVPVPAPQHVTATAIGDGRFRAVGMYAPVVGPWKVDVTLDRGATASFPLAVSGQPAPIPRATPKTVKATTWIFGALETLLIAALLAGAFRVSRRLSLQRRTTPTATEAALLVEPVRSG